MSVWSKDAPIMVRVSKTISAPVDDVWEALCDVSRWDQWALVREASARDTQGNPVQVLDDQFVLTTVQPGGRPVKEVVTIDGTSMRLSSPYDLFESAGEGKIDCVSDGDTKTKVTWTSTLYPPTGSGRWGVQGLGMQVGLRWGLERSLNRLAKIV